MSKFFWPIFVVAVLIEVVLTSTPVVLLMLLNFFVLEKKDWIFIVAFFSGILLDILNLRIIGGTSLFLISVLFLVSLYERKFETSNIYFVFVASFISSALYLITFVHFSLLQSLTSAFLGGIIFLFFNLLVTKKISSNYLKEKYDTKAHFKKI